MVVGKEISIELSNRLFGVSKIVNSVHAASLALAETEDPLVQRVWNVIEAAKESAGEELQVRVVLRGEQEMNDVSLCCVMIGFDWTGVCRSSCASSSSGC